jgi:hypothetical protein
MPKSLEEDSTYIMKLPYKYILHFSPYFVHIKYEYGGTSSNGKGAYISALQSQDLGFELLIIEMEFLSDEGSQGENSSVYWSIHVT